MPACSYFALGLVRSYFLAIAVDVAYVLVQLLRDTTSSLPLSGVQLACYKKFLYASVSQRFSLSFPSELHLLV